MLDPTTGSTEGCPSIRVDRAAFPRVSKTPEGYLRGEAIVTRTGVFKYLNADGSERLELRHPDDVLDEDSLATLSALPITVDHPTELVNADNAASLSKGMTGDSASVDGQHIKTRITVTHSDGVAAVESGMQELSLGYAVDLKTEDGEYNGQKYTHRQTNIRYNHLAIVSRGRAGAQARINLDGAAVQSDVPPQEEVIMTTELKTVAVNLDGLEYQAAPEVAKAHAKVSAELETVRADAEKTKLDMQKEIDGYQAKIDELKADMEKMKGERGDVAIAEAVKARLSLLTKASKVINTDGLSESGDREIMESVIKARHDGIDLEGKSDDYVAARFDAVVESAPDGEAIRKQAEQTRRADSSAAKPSALEIVRNQWNPKQEAV